MLPGPQGWCSAVRYWTAQCPASRQSACIMLVCFYAMWSRQRVRKARLCGGSRGSKSSPHRLQVVGKRPSVVDYTLELDRRGSSSLASFVLLTPFWFCKFRRDPGLPTDPALQALTHWPHLTKQNESQQPKFPIALGWEEVGCVSQCCATRVHQADTEVVGGLAFTVSSGEKRLTFGNVCGGKIPAHLFGFDHIGVTFCIHHPSGGFCSTVGTGISEKAGWWLFFPTALQLEQSKRREEGDQTGPPSSLCPDLPKCHLEEMCQPHPPYLSFVGAGGLEHQTDLDAQNLPNSSVGIRWFEGFLIFKHWPPRWRRSAENFYLLFQHRRKMQNIVFL